MSAMGALTAGVAHEVRNPLFGISSTLDAMEARFSNVTEFKRYVDVLHREVNRMNKLMGDLLEYGKPTALELVPASVKELIARAVNACTPLAENTGVAITQHIHPDIPSVLSDRRRLVQVFQNLLENAIHYSPRGGVVTIAAEVVGEVGKPWVECVIRIAAQASSWTIYRTYSSRFLRGAVAAPGWGSPSCSASSRHTVASLSRRTGSKAEQL